MQWIDSNNVYEEELEGLFENPMGLFTEEIRNSVEEIEGLVKTRGDAALLELTEKFDGVSLKNLKVSDEAMDEAFDKVSPEILGALKRAKENIETYHRRQLRESFFTREAKGGMLGQMISPLKRVGLYVPGGTAAYPSSVLMNAVPAVLAGVEEILLISPPQQDGKVHPGVLAAAKLLGITEVYALGGAQGIFAMTYGTESIPKVDKIVGPGNVYVTLAKKMVYGDVDIDMIAGPSEILIIAEAGQNPAFIAADLLSQAEHDPLASAVLVTPSENLGRAVLKELEKQQQNLERRDIAKMALENQGKIIITKNLEEAFQLSNRFAPEHLEILVEDPLSHLPKIRNAGCVFLGPYSPEPLGDYYAGTNHTLPTSGSARYFSPLSVDDFIKKTSLVYYTKEGLRRSRKDIERLAEYEGLLAHKNAVALRFEGEPEEPEEPKIF